jgi:hypothetical protein
MLAVPPVLATRLSATCKLANYRQLSIDGAQNVISIIHDYSLFIHR